MRLLLDTHALIWWLEDSPRLSGEANRAVSDGSVFVSAASVWEIAIKFRIGKLPGMVWLLRDLDAILKFEAFDPLPITMAHAHRAGLLPGPHRDPFDRMLIAQALIEDLTLVSKETLFDAYPIRRLW